MPTIDYGSVADWVSGVGTMLAVIAALWIAGSEQREGRKAREQKEREEVARLEEVIRESIRLGERIIHHCQTLIGDRKELSASDADATKPPAEPVDVQFLTARGFYCVHEINGMRQQLTALQSSGVSNARAYIGISRMAYEAELTYPRNIDHRKISTSELMRVEHDMDVRVKALRDLEPARS